MVHIKNIEKVKIMEQTIMQSISNTRYKAIIMQLAAAILWSFGGILIKLVDLQPIAIAGIRSFIAIFVIFPFLKRSAFKLTLNKALGAIAYTSLVLLFTSATKATTAANAILLQYTAPIYIAIFGAWLLNEKAKLKDWITILFVIAGMILFFMDDMAGGSLKGNILAIISGVALAFNTMFMRRQKDADPLENVFWGSILTMLVSLPFVFQKAPSPRSWLGLVLLGVFQIGLSYILYAKAIKKITALESTFISLIEPLLNPLWVFLTIGELPGIWSVVGGLIVLVSVTVSCLKPKSKASVETSSDEIVQNSF
jgi:drug/metabolite transporter (DMT)-like permease